MDARRALRRCVFAALLLAPFALFSRNSASHSTDKPRHDGDSGTSFSLFHAFIDEKTLEEKVDDFARLAPAGSAQQNEGQPFVERIDFEGNRRIRRDTLQARIFTRAGDPYNEETLRRDFDALWNTQFFEDVKLRVEDSP